MKSKLLVTLLLCASTFAFSQQIWNKTSLGSNTLKANKTSLAQTNQFYTLDVAQLRNTLANAPMRNALSIPQEVIVGFPKTDGTIENFYVAEAPNFSPELAANYPDIKAYRGVSVNNPHVMISFSVSHLGVKTMRLATGENTVFIEPVSVNNNVYGVFNKLPRAKGAQFSCLTDDEAGLALDLANEVASRDADDQTLRTFRLALSVVGEYSQYFGGTVADANAAINATMTRVNPIFELEMALNMEIIPNNDLVIYTNAATDPYSGINNWSNELQNTLNSVIGLSNYDIGHLFGASGGGGNAGCIGCVCGPNKGRAYTSPADAIPEGDNFDIDYVAHEMGHQFGGNHTFVASEGTGANVEPGSGSTIMGYAGITNTDIQPHSDAYFSYISILQITANIKTKTCPVETALTNSPPTADAGADYSIPSGTPFKLTASGSDPDGDPITFGWEQADVSTSGGFVYPSATATTGPLFRSLTPTVEPVRYFPSFDKVLANNLTSTWESLPTVTRILNFNIQVRDNNGGIGQTDSDRMQVNVLATNGAFRITSPAADESAAAGASYNVTWDVAGTNAAPFNSPNVNILLSTDGGDTFTTVAANVTNDGAHDVNIPVGSESIEALFMIESIGNIFYAVSPRFLIGFTANTECQTFQPSQTLPLPIADNGPFTTLTYSVPDFGNVSDVNASLDVTHTWIGDLVMFVQSPQSIQADLWNQQCGNQDNLQLTFDDSGNPVTCASPTVGTVIPSESLSTLAGNPTTGLWQIRINDNAAGDTGSVNAATLEVCTTEYTPLSVNQSTLENFALYPNPTDGRFTVTFNNKGTDATFTVYDMLGRVITSEKETTSGTISKQIDISAYPQGVYLLQVDTDNGSVSKKLIKQ